MAQIVIRNVDEAVIEALRRRAVARGTSVEEEARRILERATGLGREAAVDRFAEIRRSVSSGGPSVADDLRRDRNRASAT
jgi:plasmid stability protein